MVRDRKSTAMQNTSVKLSESRLQVDPARNLLYPRTMISESSYDLFGKCSLHSV